MNDSIIKFIKNEKILLSVVFIIFLFFLLGDIRFPGLESDEACDGLWASYILREVPAGERINNIMSITLFNRSFPVMANTPYIGAVESYLLVPFFLIFGINIFSLRFMPITIALVTVFFIYFFCKAWFGRRAAFVAVLLIITNPFFVFYSRIGLYREELFAMFFFWGGLFCFWKYLERRKALYFCLGSFLFGLGLSTKIMFLWYIMGVAIAWLILRKKKIFFPGMNLRKMALALLSFFLGSFLLIFYNIKTGGVTFQLMWNYLFHPTPYGINNLSYLHNLAVRGEQFLRILQGGFEDVKFWIDPAFVLSKDYLTPIVFMAGLVFIPFSLFFKNGKYSLFSGKKVLFLYIVYLTVFLCSPFTMSFIWFAHLFILFPFPQIIMAIFFCSLLYIFRDKKPALFIIYFVISLSVLSGILTITRYHLAMKKSGGVGAWSTSISVLAEYLYRNKIANSIALEWGFHHNVPFLTNDKVRPENVSAYPPKELAARFKDRFLKESPVYFITTTDTVVTNNEERARFELVKKTAEELNKSLILNKVFFNRSGKPVYYLYEVR